MPRDRNDPTPPRIHRIDRPDGESKAHDQARERGGVADGFDRMTGEAQADEATEPRGSEDGTHEAY